MTENCMLSVEPWSRHVGDEELASVGVRTAVCHGDDTWLVMLEADVELVGE